MEEFEIKFLDIDVPILEKKLLEIGATKVAEYHYFVALFDYPDWRMDKEHAWLKLRTDGKETTISYKQRIGVKDDGSIGTDEGMKEIEVGVDDYKKLYELFLAMGLIVKREMEKKRIRYKKDNYVYDIDSWPRIPTFVEIESDSLENAKSASRLAGFDPDKGLICSASQVYKNYGYDPNDYSVMTFKDFTKK